YQKALKATEEVVSTGCQSLKGAAVNERLIEVLTLYAAGDVDDRCMDQEANWALTQDGSLPLIYLAKSFSQSKTDLSDRYLERVCAEVSSAQPLYEAQACRFSHLIQDWSLWLEKGTSEARVQTLLDIGADYALVWGARQFFSRAWWQETLQLLEPLQDN